MRVDAVASFTHYESHLRPIFDLLPNDVRGTMWGARHGLGLPTLPHGWDRDRLVLCAGWVDVHRSAPRRCVLVEHGAGQAYGADARSARHPSYSGGNRHEDVALFVCPSETVAARWRERYPDTPTAAVGSPRLDDYHALSAATRSTTAVGDLALGGDNPAGVKIRRRAGPVVAITFHYELSLVPETMSALPHYEKGLEPFLSAAKAHGWEVLGHGHPRLWRRIERVWRHLGVEPVRDLAAVYDRADVLCVDNSSAGPEFASLGKPLVWMNAPWYRRQVEHGGRFWNWPEGQVMVDGPDELAAAVAHALDDPPEVRAAREAMVRDVYAFTDGHASERAAAAVVELARGI